VDTVPLTVDESPHPGIPTTGLVSEVHAGLEKFAESDLRSFWRACGQFDSFRLWVSIAP
jgi:hypothetical protein